MGSLPKFVSPKLGIIITREFDKYKYHRVILLIYDFYDFEVTICEPIKKVFYCGLIA